MSVPYEPNSKLFYHKYMLKSLTRLRESLAKQRFKYLVQLTNVLDIVFPSLSLSLTISFLPLLFIYWINPEVLKKLLMCTILIRRINYLKVLLLMLNLLNLKTC